MKRQETTTTTTSSSSSSSSSFVSSSAAAAAAAAAASTTNDNDYYTTTTKTPQCQYHPPPTTDGSQVKYDNNDTVFGHILRGELPAVTLAENNHLLAFQDRHPRAPLHALVIPKAYIGTIFDISGEDLPLLQDMRDMALQLVAKQFPTAFAKNDYRLVFHVPPFNSVQHLHLHVLASLSEMKCWWQFKYWPGARWCISLETVMTRLKKGQSATPYRRPFLCRPQHEMQMSIKSTALEMSKEDEEEEEG